MNLYLTVLIKFCTTWKRGFVPPIYLSQFLHVGMIFIQFPYRLIESSKVHYTAHYINGTSIKYLSYCNGNIRQCKVQKMKCYTMGLNTITIV